LLCMFQAGASQNKTHIATLEAMSPGQKDICAGYRANGTG